MRILTEFQSVEKVKKVVAYNILNRVNRESKKRCYQVNANAAIKTTSWREKKRKHKILQEENILLGVSKDEDEETMTVNTERATT